MDYQQAKDIRKKSFGTMLAEEEGGLFSSLSKTISKRNQAKMTGLKERFDPLNIAKFITGGSNWAPAMLGKMFGADKKRIDYFSGVKQRNKNTADKLGLVGGGDSSFIGILLNIEKLLHDGREEDKLQKQKNDAFAEEKEYEKNRRHKELIEAITGKKYTVAPNKTATKVDDVTTEKTFLENIIDFLSDLKFLKAIASRIPLLAFLLGLYEAKQYLDSIDYGDKMKKNEGKIAEKAFREKLVDFSKHPLSKKEAQALLNDDEPARTRGILQFGGIERVQAIADGKPDPGGVSPKQKTYEEHRQEVLPATVEPRPAGNSGKIKAKQNDWDRKNSKDYNPDGTRKTATPVENKPTPADEKPAAATTPSKEVPPEVKSASEIPVENPPAAVALNQAQKENINLNIPVSRPDPSTVVNNNVNSSSFSDDSTRVPLPLVRNSEETFQQMILYSTRVV